MKVGWRQNKANEDAVWQLLNQLFTVGFYRQYSGLFLLSVLLFTGMCPPGELWNVFVQLAAVTVSKGWLLGCVTILFSCYLFLVVAFIRTQYGLDSYRFLRYSIGALSHGIHDRYWLGVLLINGLPILFFAGVSIVVGYGHGQWALSSLFFIYIVGAFALGFRLILHIVEPLRHRDTSVLFFDIGTKWGSPYTWLGIRYLFFAQRVPFLIAKLLSYIFVNGLFFVYADVKDHSGVVMLVLTALVMGHSTIIVGQFLFERESLSFFRNLPHRKPIRWIQVALRLLIVVLPEAVWLLVRYPLPDAMLYIAYLWSFSFFIYHLFFLLSPKDSYVNWLFFLFFALAILSPWGIMLPLVLVFFLISVFVYLIRG